MIILLKINMKIKILINWDLKKIIWTKYFIVSSDFLFLLIIYWKKYHIRVPKWFITDFGSIPPIFFFFDKSRYISYILHDFLYSLIWQTISINWILEYDKNIADEILVAWLKAEWMIESGQVLVLLWVSIWWKPYYKKRNEEISNLKKTL